MIRNAGILVTPKRTVIRRLVLACMLLAGGVTPSLAQGGVDTNTLLLLRFENSLNGEQGETPAQAFGTTFEAGIVGQGVLVDSFDILKYQTAGNFNMTAGTIEFWIRPRWNSVNFSQRDFFSVGAPSAAGDNRLTLFKSVQTHLRFNIKDVDSEAGQNYPSLPWSMNEWHHVAVTWTVPGRMITYIDGFERLNHASGTQDVLSPLPPELLIGSGGSSFTQINAVVDELRISNVARTPEEIAARFFGVVTVNSLSLSVTPQNLWKTWRVTPTVTAATSHGTYRFPSSGVSWSSSNPGVATVDDAGRIVGVGAGSAVLTANVNGVKASLSVNVRAPALEPRLNPISDYLATPAAGALYDVPVVIFRYLPTADGVNLDTAWSPDYYTLNPITLARLERDLDLYDPGLKFMLEEGSRFRGYGSQAMPPSLGYRVVAIITVYEPTPPGLITRFKQDPMTGQNLPMYDADWFQIFDRFGMRDYVNNHGVKEVWFYWGGVQPEIPSYDPAIHPPENMREGWESNMSSPTTADVSNSNQRDGDLPVYDRTYIVYGRNIRRLDAGTIHVDGHQLESMMTYANRRQTGDTEMFWQKFAGLTAGGAWQRGRAGDAHHPPNAVDHYDYGNVTPFDSDIMDWKPDGGQLTPYSAATHMNVPYRFPDNFAGANLAESNWHIFWRQSMPGRDNTIPFGTNRMTNWWQFVGDWDAAMRAGLGLYEPAACSYSLSAGGQNFAAGGGTGGVNVTAGAGCRWMASSNAPWVKLTSGDTGNDGSATVNFSVAPNVSAGLRDTTIIIAGQAYVVTQAPAPPLLLTEPGTQRATALASVMSVRDPFPLFTPHNFSPDRRTRVMLFAAGVELTPGEDVSVVTAQAEDSLLRVFPLAVEFVGKVPGFDWLTQINVRLPDELANAGDVRVSIALRGVPSNKALVSVGSSQ